MNCVYRSEAVLTSIAFLFFALVAGAQTVPVGSIGDDNLRMLQLDGRVGLEHSFAARPFFSPANDSNYSIIKFKGFHQKAVYKLLPITLWQKMNSRNAYGWNDAGMIRAKGYEVLISAGLYAAWGPASIQLQPEAVYAQNSQYAYNSMFGSIVKPNYKKVFGGQSSLRLNAGSFSLGISTENMWWGPGMYNSLLMSNNAPGFVHLTFNTTRPVKTPVGIFEWQLIAGKLKYDPLVSSEPYFLRYYTQIFGDSAMRSHDWRYTNGIVMTYQPKWVNGLFLGITREFTLYHSDLGIAPTNFIDSYLPVFKAFAKNKNVNEDAKRRDQILSLFFRWVLPKEKAEFYVDYGFNDHSVNLRDFTLSPVHSTAYLAGFQKLFHRKTGENWMVNVELTQLAQTPNYLVREAGNWYIHGEVLESYTNNNQVIGAGVGSGNNSQTLSVKRIEGIKQLGVIVERIEHDPVSRPVNWTDISIGFIAQQKFDKLLLSARLQFIHSRNYAWDQNINAFNIYGFLKASYQF